MEEVESRFRNTPSSDKNYVKNLIKFVEFLLSNGRVLEAKYFFSDLFEFQPDNPVIIKLGYSLSIVSFDNEGVRKFDRLLYESSPKDTELCHFRLKYYISSNQLEHSEDCCVFLLSQSIGSDCLTNIIEACANFQSYKVAKALTKYLTNKNMILTDIGHNRIRQILLKKLFEIIRSSAYA